MNLALAYFSVVFEGPFTHYRSRKNLKITGKAATHNL